MLAVPLSAVAEAVMTTQFQARSVGKRYLCMARGLLPAAGVVDKRLHVVSKHADHFRVYVSPQGKKVIASPANP